MQTVVDRLIVNYEVVGKKESSLLILHGWRDDMNGWRAVAHALSIRHRVILLDLPGFGSSGLPPANWGVGNYADFILKFLATLKVKKCIILGHSFGGRLGILLASSSDVCDRLVLVDSAGVEGKSLKAKTAIALVKLYAPFKRWLPGFLSRFIKNSLGSPDYLQSVGLREVFKNVVNFDLSARASQIRCPVLIIWGENDQEMPIANALKLKNLIKGSKLRVVWGTGHMPQRTKPEDFLSILAEEGI